MDRIGPGATGSGLGGTHTSTAAATTTQAGESISASSSSAFLDDAAEAANRQVDVEIKTLVDAFDALIGLCRIRDKDKVRIAQERLEAEARADTMVRAVQSLTLLSHSLKLSLLLAQEPIGAVEGSEGGAKMKAQVTAHDDDDDDDDRDTEMEGAADVNTTEKDTFAPPTSLNDEALRLIEDTLRSRKACAALVQELMRAPGTTKEGQGVTRQ